MRGLPPPTAAVVAAATRPGRKIQLQLRHHQVIFYVPQAQNRSAEAPSKPNRAVAFPAAATRGLRAQARAMDTLGSASNSSAAKRKTHQHTSSHPASFHPVCRGASPRQEPARRSVCALSRSRLLTCSARSLSARHGLACALRWRFTRPPARPECRLAGPTSHRTRQPGAAAEWRR